MGFETVLQKIVDDCGGGYGASLMGMDGIAIAQVTARTGIDREDPLHGDVTSAGIEFGRILLDMSKASDALGGGPLREAVVHLERVSLIFHSVDDDVVLVLALAPEGNLGKARYLIRRHLIELREQL